MPLHHSNEQPKFLERLPRAPHFSARFVESIIEHFKTIDNSSIDFTNRPDMRIRRYKNNGRGFINAATLQWRSRNERFILSTALSEQEINSFNLRLERVINDPLPSLLYVDNTLFNSHRDDILKLLEYAAKNRRHPIHD